MFTPGNAKSIFDDFTRIKIRRPQKSPAVRRHRAKPGQRESFRALLRGVRGQDIPVPVEADQMMRFQPVVFHLAVEPLVNRRKLLATVNALYHRLPNPTRLLPRAEWPVKVARSIRWIAPQRCRLDQGDVFQQAGLAPRYGELWTGR